MSEVKNIKEKIKNKKLSKSALILIICSAIILIPCITFGLILGISALQTGSPRDGSRFSNDLSVEIKNSDVETIEKDLKTIANTESVKVILSEGQLKVFIDTDDSLNEANVDKIVDEAYSKVTSRLPVGTYFTRTETDKMYDLQINVYTSAEATEIGSSSPRIYKYLHKNAAEEKYQIDNLGTPKDPSIAAELEGLTTTSTDEQPVDEQLENEE